MKNKKIILTIVLTLIALSTMSTLSNAALQSNYRDYKSDTATNWIINVRNMEAKNGGMGLNEAIDNTTGLSTTASNGIDVHLQKNTEYGAAILLGASDYGKQGAVGGTSNTRYMNQGSTTITGTDLKASTTGNVTGIYNFADSNYWEWTAGGGTEFLSNIAPRYRDIYETNAEGKAGDATIEGEVDLGNWHGGSSYHSLGTGNYGVLRNIGSTKNVFSYTYKYSNEAYIRYSNGTYNYYGARACVVSAPGI